MAEVAEMLGVTERTFRRWSDRDEADGAEGLEDRRLGRASARAVPAAESGTAFVPWTGSTLADMRCLQEDRVVAHDNTVRYQGLRLQIPPDRHRFHYGKGTVRVHEYSDGTLTVFHGIRGLARYQPDGRVIESEGTYPRRRGPTQRSGDRSIGDPSPHYS